MSAPLMRSAISVAIDVGWVEGRNPTTILLPISPSPHLPNAQF